MARNLDSALLTQLQAQKFSPVIFVEIDFLSGPIYIWSGVGSITWNGQTWLGVGQFGTISGSLETRQIRADNLVLSLSGIPSDLLGQAMDEIRQGKTSKLWLAAMAADGSIVAPYQAFAGRVDVANVEDGDVTSTIAITVESHLVDLQRPRSTRYTHEDQQVLSAGDDGFIYVTTIQDWSGTWGKGDPVGISTGPGDGSDHPGDGGLGPAKLVGI